MRLARVDDQSENDWLRATADATVGSVDFYIGAEAPTETLTWQWPDGAVFWIGKDTGSAQGGLFAHWLQKRPLGTTIRACALMASGAGAGFWYDSSCTLMGSYVCEAY
jgi:hypothetical protein